MTNGQKIVDKLIEIHGSKDFSIAFLPYKRSMFSSMRSVYEACEGIDAKIYPLPYYLMNHKGHVEKIVKDYFEDARDIKDFKGADYIVIHYPYDSHNAVTQMLPEYYIERLKRKGKVVYIPYSQVSKSFLWIQQGVRFCDIVFLNNEADATEFIRLWKSRGEDFTGRVFGLGSPKLDISGDDKAVPGSVLVTTSLMHFLRDPVSRMALWKRYIDREQGKAVTFRPHPLLMRTIKAMRPDMLSRYIAFLDSLTAKIDLSEDLENALLTHEYLISDPSSVIEMWAALGKPYEVMRG